MALHLATAPLIRTTPSSLPYANAFSPRNAKPPPLNTSLPSGTNEKGLRQAYSYSNSLRRVVAMATATEKEARAETNAPPSSSSSNPRLVSVDGKNVAFKIQEMDQGGVKDWHSATVISVEEVAPGVRNITLETECSREMVALENAYSAPGRLAQVKVTSGKIFKVAAASPPFSMKINDSVLYKLRGDIPAGTTKQPQYFFSVKAPLELLVFNSESPEFFAVKEGDNVEVGPFDPYGLDLRPILFLIRFPTILFFASGKGIAVAKSIIETKDADVGSLSLSMRDDIRLFYWSQDPSKVLYKENFGKWENEKLKVRAAVGELNGQEWDGHVGSLTTLWDEDDIEYDPQCTGVVVCVEPELRKEINDLLSEAGIEEKQIIRWEP